MDEHTGDFCACLSTVIKICWLGSFDFLFSDLRPRLIVDKSDTHKISNHTMNTTNPANESNRTKMEIHSKMYGKNESSTEDSTHRAVRVAEEQKGNVSKWWPLGDHRNSLTMMKHSITRHVRPARHDLRDVRSCPDGLRDSLAISKCPKHKKPQWPLEGDHRESPPIVE